MGESGAKSKSPWPFDVARVVEGSETPVRGWYRQAKATKRVGTGDRESEHFTVPRKQGNPNRKETLWRKGNVVIWNR